MPSAKLILIVPDDPEALVDPLLDHGAESDDLDVAGDPDAVLEGLRGRVGEVVGFAFDADDPIDPLYDLAKALDAAGGRYWGCSDAFEERSRGMRVTGRVLVNADGTRRELVLPWEEGPPDLDGRTLRAAGLSREEASVVEAAFFERVAPTPTGP